MTVKPLKLSEFLPFRLSLASNLVSRRIADTYEREYGLTMTQWRVMAVLGETPGLTGTELVSRTALDKVAVSRAAAALVTRGLLERQAEPQDGRRSTLYLTDEGLKVYKDVIPQAVKFEQDLLAALPEDTRKALDRALLEITEAAKG